MQIKRSKSKEMQIKMLAFPLDSFGGIRIFQGVMADSNKKFQPTVAFHKIFLKCIPQSGIALSRRRSPLILPNG
jgi:hypothetical protein